MHRNRKKNSLLLHRKNKKSEPGFVSEPGLDFTERNSL